jgi:hypothetical protein
MIVRQAGALRLRNFENAESTPSSARGRKITEERLAEYSLQVSSTLIKAARERLPHSSGSGVGGIVGTGGAD